MNPALWRGERVYVDSNVLIYVVEADMPREHGMTGPRRPGARTEDPR